MLRSLFFIATFFLWTLAVLLVSLALSFRGPDFLYRCGRIWARVGLRLAGVRVDCQEVLPPATAETVIYMANHQSNFDILALLACVRRPFRWLAKKELFRIPLFGAAMRAAGCIEVDRADREKAVASMDEAVRRIQQGESVIIFPEGTRSPDARLLPFKKGGFMTALKAGVPIVPIAIRGSGAILPKHSLRLRPGTISVTFLPPVATAGLTLAERDRLMAQVREALSASLPDGAAA